MKKNIDDMINVVQKDNAVEIEFSKDLPEEMIEEQVSSCQASTCTCCTPVFREKVEDFSTTTTEEGIKVIIKGDITKEQVQENVLGCAPKLQDSAEN